MDPDAVTVFRELADRSPSEREEYYVQRQVPAAVRDEVESLLRFDSAAGDSIAASIASAAKQVLLDAPQQPEGSLSSAVTLPPAVAIGRYQVVRLLGRGGMGEVYLARDPVLDRNVAVKLIGRELNDDAARKRLVQEARAAGRLRHANIVTIFDAGEHAGQSYIAMEYVPGETLRSLIRRRAPLPLRHKLELIEGACAGLAHAHHAGVIHLDIKPDNLMLDENGIVKVLDFGIARVLKGETLITRHLAGTLSYMSPEQIAGRPLDRRSDVFSLGCAFFELLVYSPAYAGSTQQIVTRITAGPVPKLLDVSPEIDPRLDAIVSRAMALDLSDRYDDLDDLRVELARLRTAIAPVKDEPLAPRPISVVSENPAAAPTPVFRATSRRSSFEQGPSARWRFPGAISIGVFAVLAAAGAFLIWEARTPRDATPAAPAVLNGSASSESARPVERGERNATRPSDEVWRRLATGDRRGVLAFLEAPPANRGVPPDVRLPYDVLEAVRTSVLRTRAAAATGPGAVSSTSYRSAEERFARADRLEADGRPVEALSALWQAADHYTQAGALGQRQPPPPSEVKAPIPTQPAVVSGSIAEPPLPPPVVESPPPERLAPSPAETAGIDRAVSPDANAPKPSSDPDAILETLRRYQAAYEALEISGVLQVFPSLGRDQVEQLRRTFEGMMAYSIEVRNPLVDVQANTATVRAVVFRRMVPRVGGRPVSNEIETEFRLRRAGSGWVITAVTAQNQR